VARQRDDPLLKIMARLRPPQSPDKGGERGPVAWWAGFVLSGRP
jgi:hypothetical protein